MPTAVTPTLDESRKDSRIARLPVSIDLSSQAPPQAFTDPSRNSNASKFAGKRVHFIGIGGCGMCGLARMLLDAGAVVSGSEPQPGPQTFALTQRGVKISRGQLGELLDASVDLVIRTAAVHDNNTEFLAARRLNLRCIKYAQLLGEVMAERLGVAVAGTHGKSTTTAMISHALIACGADPSFVVGGTAPQLGGGSRSGAGPVFVAEACEFDRSFHHLRPRIAIITNIEEDHLDCYRDIDEIVESFATFGRLVPAGGLIISNAFDAHARQALSRCSAPIEWVGDVDGWEVWPTGIFNGCHVGHVRFKGKPVATLRLSVPGEHNLFNATMALAACRACGIDVAAAAEAISSFTGVDRRMTEMGQCNGATVVDDYGHHPTEIRATLQALRERYAPRRLWCVFQPHQHSRTRFLLEDFARSFHAADETIVPDIYFVRDSEAERQRVSSTDLVERIVADGSRARHVPHFADIVVLLRREAAAGDLIVTMGAGNVWEIGKELTEQAPGPDRPH
jgi:UDP-N-acetylmuramate--alanine ligase